MRQVHINKNYRVVAEKLGARGANGIFLGYKGDYNFIVWLVDGGRLVRTPHVVFHETMGDHMEAPDPRDIVRSLL